MDNKYKNLSEQDFYNKYIELLQKGYSDNSPEMLELFKSRTQYQVNSQKNTNSQVYENSQNSTSTVRTRIRTKPQTPNQTNYKSQNQTNTKTQSSDNPFIKRRTKPDEKISKQQSSYNTKSQTKTKTTNNYAQNISSDSVDYRSHIVIDPDSGNYTLLDSKLNIVDTMHTESLFSFFTQGPKLRKFNKQLKSDFKKYKKMCNKNMPIDPNFKKMYKLTKYYLKLCPDADYQILELIRNNITKINPTYANYQTACAEYLYELAQLRDGDPDKMPFDINFCCDKINSNHSYISYRFDYAPDPVLRFKTIYSQIHNTESDFQSSIKYNAQPVKTKFSNVKNVRTPDTHER